MCFLISQLDTLVCKQLHVKGTVSRDFQPFFGKQKFYLGPRLKRLMRNFSFLQRHSRKTCVRFLQSLTKMVNSFTFRKKYDKSNNKFNLNTFQKLNAHVVVDYRDPSDIIVDYVYTMSAYVELCKQISSRKHESFTKLFVCLQVTQVELLSHKIGVENLMTPSLSGDHCPSLRLKNSSVTDGFRFHV